MGRRFYHQQRAAQYAAEKIVIDNWTDKTAAQKSELYATQIQKTGNKKSNVGTEPGYIIPFGYAQSKKVYLQVGLVKEGRNLVPTEENEGAMITALRTLIIGTDKYALSDKPTTTGSFITDVSRKRIQLARIKIVRVGNTLSEKIESRITGRKYTYTKKDAVSCPFGQKIGGSGDDLTFEGVSATFLGLTVSPAALAAFSVYTSPQGKLPISAA